MIFSRELHDDILSGDLTVSFRLWRRPKVKVGRRYPFGPVHIEIDSLELLPFASITSADVRRSGEKDRESLRHRAAHAGPIGPDTLLYRVEFHIVEPEDVEPEDVEPEDVEPEDVEPEDVEPEDVESEQ